MKRNCLIFNAKAGAANNLESLFRRFMSAPQCDFRATSSASDVKCQVEAAVAQGAERIIVAGGDGTISRVVDAMAADFAQTELAILPLGTGNDLARSLGIPLDNLEAALSLAFTSEAVAVDVVRVFDGKTTYLINAASAGFGGKVASSISAADKARWGAFAYWMTAFSELVNLPQFDIRLELDRDSFDLRVYGLTIANGRYLGGGFPIARGAFVNDGLLDVTVIPVLPALDLVAAGLNYMIGVESGGDRLRNFKSKRVHVTATPEMLFSIDGDPIREIDTTLEVLPQALHVVAAANAPAIRGNGQQSMEALPGPTSLDQSLQEAG